MSPTTTQAVRELDCQWIAAEEAGDVTTLDALSTDDFTLVGPLGFVLDKQQWLDRYRAGALVTRSLVWDEVTVRDYGNVAVIIGRHTQQATYQGNPVDGQFRATHIAVHQGNRWVLAGLHLSPIGRPPFSPPASPPQK